MPSTMYVWEGANLFCNSDPSESKAITMEQFKLPTLEEMFQDHHAGGSIMQIEISTGLKKLEPTFKLKGYDPDLLGQFGLTSPIKRIFTAYGAYRDRQTGELFQGMAVMHGRLGKIEPDAHKRGEFVGHDYAINECLHYELYFGGDEKIFFDFFNNTWRVDGVDQVADVNTALALI